VLLNWYANIWSLSIISNVESYFQYIGNNCCIHAIPDGVVVCVIQLNGNVQSSELRNDNLTVRLQDGSVIRISLIKPSTLSDLKTVHNLLLVAKNASVCKCVSEHQFYCISAALYKLEINGQLYGTGSVTQRTFTEVTLLECWSVYVRYVTCETLTMPSIFLWDPSHTWYTFSWEKAKRIT